MKINAKIGITFYKVGVIWPLEDQSSKFGQNLKL